MTRALMMVVAALPVMALAACGSGPTIDPSRQVGTNPELPAPHQFLLPPMKIAKSAPWRGNEAPTAAAGLRVAAFARNLDHPRALYTLPNGDVLVVEANGPGEPVHRPKTVVMDWIEASVGAGSSAKSADRITLLRDSDGDGVPEQRTIFLDHLHSPFGIVLVGHDLYVANTDAIVRFPYADGETRIVAPGTKVTDLPAGTIDHHWTKSLIASADGSKLYVGVGSNSNVGENGIDAETGRAAIWEVDRATGAHRVLANGLRNPTGLALEPTSHAVWAVVNERDEIGPDLVPDYLTAVRDGAFYGWPYSYYGQHIEARVRPQRPDLVAKAVVPDYALASHVAPLGLVFANSSSLPPAYRAGAIISEHGSWDRKPLSGYKLIFVPFANGRPSGPPRDLVTGFLDDQGRAHGRPVGVALDRSGAVLVADDMGNVVWRVSAG